jgi:predicted alpha/beta-hydrolase family hydrolase
LTPAARSRITTPRGEAAFVLAGRGTKGLLVLGHGASGGVDTADLVAVSDAAVDAGYQVARVTQPYRLLPGRRPPPAAAILDEAWRFTVDAIREQVGPKVPVVVGGRSAGARVACRTARELGARGVLALAFPLHPPGRPDKSRAGELDRTMPTLVVNGDRDPFGIPEPGGEVRVVVRAGETHALSKDPAGVAQVAVEWLTSLLARPTGRSRTPPKPGLA